MTTAALADVRCRKCGKLLLRSDCKNGRIEIVCQRCSTSQTVKLAGAL